MPLMAMVFTSTGASPLMVMEFLFVLKLFPPLLVMANAALAPSLFKVLNKELRIVAIQPFTADGELTVTLSAAKAAYFAAMTGLTLAFSIGPLAISLNARRSVRRNVWFA